LNSGACTQTLRLEEKSVLLMDEVQGPTKLQISVCEVEGYYWSDSSLPSPKGVFCKKNEAESFKMIIMGIKIIVTNS